MRVQCASLVLLLIGRECWFHRAPGFPQVALKVTMPVVFFAMWPEPKMADGSSARHALFLKLFLLFGRSEVFCRIMTFHVSESQVLPSIVITGMCLSKRISDWNLFDVHIARTCDCSLSACMSEFVMVVCSFLFLAKGSAPSSYRSHFLSHGVEW